MAHGVETC